MKQGSFLPRLATAKFRIDFKSLSLSA